MSSTKGRALLIAALTALMVAALASIAGAGQPQCPPGQVNQNGYCQTDPDDPDGDGLNNDTERDLGTNPNDADTDDDGFRDRQDRCPSLAGPNGGCPSFQSGQQPSQTPPRGRVRPARVDLNTTKSRGRRGGRRSVTLASTGTVVPPEGLSVAEACRDDAIVRITVKSRSRTVSSRTASMDDNCAFASEVTFTALRRLRGRSMKVQATFTGNDALRSAESDFVQFDRP